MTDDLRAAPAVTARQPRAIHSALTVLEAVAELGPGVTARELSGHLGLPRATAYRLLNLLVADEYLVRTTDLSGFALGAKVAQLAEAVSPVRLPTAARLLVAEARTSLRAGVHIVGFEGARLVIVDEDPDFPLRYRVRLSRDPGVFALGRLLLVAQGDTGPVGRAAAAELGARGAVRVEHVPASIGCLAVPIRDAHGHVAGALAFAGPRHRIIEPAAIISHLAPVAERIAPFVT